MKNFDESGDYFYVTLTEDTAPGQLVIVNELAGIAVSGGRAGERIVCQRRGVFSYPKVAGVIDQGAKVYLKADEDAVTKTATGNTLVGYAHEPAAADDAGVFFVLKC